MPWDRASFFALELQLPNRSSAANFVIWDQEFRAPVVVQGIPSCMVTCQFDETAVIRFAEGYTLPPHHPLGLRQAWVNILNSAADPQPAAITLYVQGSGTGMTTNFMVPGNDKISYRLPVPGEESQAVGFALEVTPPGSWQGTYGASLVIWDRDFRWPLVVQGTPGCGVRR